MTQTASRGQRPQWHSNLRTIQNKYWQLCDLKSLVRLTVRQHGPVCQVAGISVKVDW
jgi:hypothetical protein